MAIFAALTARDPRFDASLEWRLWREPLLVADICARISTPAPVVGGDGVSYVVQREWSNRMGACIVSR